MLSDCTYGCPECCAYAEAWRVHGQAAGQPLEVEVDEGQVMARAMALTPAATRLLAAAEQIKVLDGQLESARAWTVALENRIERALDIAAKYAGDYAFALISAALDGATS